MARTKTLNASIINITTQIPHSPERYQNLFRRLRDLTPPPSGKMRGDRHLMLNYFGEQEDTISGVFATYTHIDPSSPWWDTANRKAIVDPSGQPIPQVTGDVAPNLLPVNFILLLPYHRIIFDTRNVSPSSFAAGLGNIFRRSEICDEFGQVFITVEPEHGAYEQLMRIAHKKKIQLVFSLPNQDVPSALETRIRERLERQNIAKTAQQYAAPTGGDITPDDELKATMKMASSNGHVTISGRDADGEVVMRSTRDMPIKIKQDYQEDHDYWRLLKSMGQRAVELIRQRPND